jgi:Xaa-Pro aminopeptidase
MAIYAAFENSEYLERLARARKAVRAAGIDCCICFAPETLFYIAGYDSWTAAVNPQGLVFTANDDAPTLLIRDYDLALARESTWLADVRTYRLHVDRPEEILADIVRQKSRDTVRVGVELQTAAVTGAFSLELVKALSFGTYEDASLLLGDLRLTKSDSELRYLREAARHAQAGLEETRRALRAGRSEIAVAADVEAAVRRAGSDYWAIPIEFTTGPRTAAGHGTPRPRIIEPGDLAHFEFAGVAARYHATAITTMAVSEPSDRAKALHRICADSLRAGIAAVRVGAPASDVENASLGPLRREGLDCYAVARFGYGIGIAYPPVWLETLQIDRSSKQILQDGMVFVLHTTISIPDEGLGTVQGGTYALINGGLQMLVGGGDEALMVA